jgi:cytochrome c oxidase accessory protein FixG
MNATPSKPANGTKKSGAPLSALKQSLYAQYVRVYPKAVHGPVRRVKWAVLIACLAVYYVLPWIRWDRGPGRPNQAILLDIASRRFYFFNVELWPQDIYLLTGALIVAAVSLFLVTSLFGRLWCGYSCPQTVWTDLFMLVERWIQGDRAERMKRDQGPHGFGYAWRKGATHLVWLAIAFWTGGAWIMYYADAPTVVVDFWTGRAALPVYLFTFLFTFTTYLLAGWAREQVCTYMCPWPRFQSSMLDEQTLVVTYEGFRGEPRSRHAKREHEADEKVGDCVDCGACVAVCPTGIDIRDGIQLSCINCGLCIDACNPVMERLHRPRDLITWDTLAGQAAKAAGKPVRMRLIRPRTMIYAGALTVAVLAIGVAFVTRSTLGLTVEHDRAPLFVRLPDGSIRNGFTLRVVNKTQTGDRFELAVDGLPGATVRIAEGGAAGATGSKLTVPVPADDVATFRVLVSGPVPAGGRSDLTFALRNLDTGETATRNAAFLAAGGAEGAVR